MKHADLDLADVASTWTAFQKSVGGLAPIRNEREYRRTVALLNKLLDIVGGDETHPLMALLELVGDLVASWEAHEVPMPDVSPRNALRMLMDANGLRQTDLQRDLGGSRS